MKRSSTVVAVMAVVGASMLVGCANIEGTKSRLPDGARLTTDGTSMVEGFEYQSIVSNGNCRYTSIKIPKRSAEFASIQAAKGTANTSMIDAYGRTADAAMVQLEKMAAAYLGLQGTLGAQQVDIARISANLEMYKAQLAATQAQAQQAVTAATAAQATATAAQTAATAFKINGLPVEWVNVDCSKARLVGPFTFVSYEVSDQIRWAYGDISHWPIGSNPAGCHGIFWFAVQRGAVWVANKYDHIGGSSSDPQTVKTLENIRTGYAKDSSGQPIYPAPGEQVAFGIASYDGAEIMGPAILAWQ